VAKHSVVAVDDVMLQKYILSAQNRLLIMAPGVSESVADSIIETWKRLGQDKTTVILDVDPEVCRLGFGTIEAVEKLDNCAREFGGILAHQPGVRIGLLVCDGTTIIFSPTPLLIESADTNADKTNAIMLDTLPSEVADDIGLGSNGYMDRSVGLDPVKPQRVEIVKKDLVANPPIKFDVARIERVFNAQFEFVEFEVRHCFISRKTVPINSDLMGLANDEKAQRLLRSSFRVVDKDSAISGDDLLHKKKRITDDYLITLQGYGTVILKSNKYEFQKSINELKTEMECFQKLATETLRNAMEANRESLVNALTPGVLVNPPERWSKVIGKTSSNADKIAMLNDDLDKAFGEVESLVKKMDVKVIYKALTYAMLNDPEFAVVANRALPVLRKLYDEHLAAPESKQT